MREPTVLISAEDDALRQTLKLGLLGYGYQIIESADDSCTLTKLRTDCPDLVVLGASPKRDFDALRLADQIRLSNKEVPLILITANSSEELAIAALRSGIDDYFKHPLSFERLNAAFKGHLSSVTRGETPTSRQQDASALIGGERMVGDSALLREIKAYISKIAPTDSTVLVTGETGTGKELVAQLIHNNSARRKGPFVCINCAAIPDTLLESELFGHDKGAFTGAYSSKKGRLELANSGTVFFDEIGDMSPYAQAKILRTLESREVHTLGGQSNTRVNIRVVAATNQDLKQLAEQGKFRKDLFFRLNVARIVLPPLRSRKEDIPGLFDHYIRRFNRFFGQQVEGFREETLQYLSRHDWPGNVRELKNLIEAIFLNRPSRRISLADLPHYFQVWSDGTHDKAPSEQEQLLSALFSTNWNKSKAAQRLHWSRMTVYRKIAKYHLTKQVNELPADV